MGMIIESVSATGGFLEACNVGFVPGLTCIIGARGTCKSTLIESIRFAFDADKRKIAELIGSDNDGLISVTLGAGSVRCQLHSETATGGSRLTIEREVGDAPRLYQEGVREFQSMDVAYQVEVFSQGELQRIVTDESAHTRMALIDRPNHIEISRLDSRRKDAADKLRALGPELRTLRLQVSQLREELRAEPTLHEQMKGLVANRPALSEELEASQQAYERRQNILKATADAIQVVNDCQSLSEGLHSQVDRLDRLIQTIAEQSDRSADSVLNAISKMRDCLKQAQGSIVNARGTDLTHLHAQLTKDFEQKNDPYFRLRQQQQVANDSLKKEEVLKRQINHMKKLRADHDGLRQRETELIEQRRALRGEIAHASEQIYQLRVREIGEINREHGNVVFLTLMSGQHSDAYVSRLSGLLTGSRIRAQEDVAADLAEKIPPTELIDLVEASDAAKIAEALGRDLGQMNRVVAHLADHSSLYELEANVPEDRLEITMYDNGQPKPVDTLSEGQRATALLPLILRPLPYPLLFDQPEDDLDNSFIFKSMIPTIIKLKGQRQLIFVTHNANIPVLGEAERVVVMTMKGPRNAAPIQCGNVDECKRAILDLLEGGAQAFEERERRYGELLHGTL
jgi:predicted ATPase